MLENRSYPSFVNHNFIMRWKRAIRNYHKLVFGTLKQDQRDVITNKPELIWTPWDLSENQVNQIQTSFINTFQMVAEILAENYPSLNENWLLLGQRYTDKTINRQKSDEKYRKGNLS